MTEDIVGYGILTSERTHAKAEFIKFAKMVHTPDLIDQHKRMKVSELGDSASLKINYVGESDQLWNILILQITFLLQLVKHKCINSRVNFGGNFSRVNLKAYSKVVEN